MSRIVVGLAGGSSQTTVFVADEHGEHLATVRGPGCAVRPGEAARSAEVIAGIVRDALAEAGVPGEQPAMLCAGVSGVGRDDERIMLWRELTTREVAHDIVVQIDATIAMEDAFGEGPGILLIAGVGSIAYGRDAEGTQARCGGWGTVAGDEGGGAWLGRRALNLVTAAADGRVPPTLVTAGVLEQAGVRNLPDLIPWASTATPTQLASLAAAVCESAGRGDEGAARLLHEAAAALGAHVQTLVARLFPSTSATVAVAFTGGLLAPGAVLRGEVENWISASVPRARPIPEEIVPARGAVDAALRMLGVSGASRRFAAAVAPHVQS